MLPAMAVRLVESAIAAGFGAGDALIQAKVKTKGPGNIPWGVIYEASGIAVGFFGDKVGLGADVRDSVLLASMALAGARLTRVSLAGNLAKGPSAWGGDFMSDPGGAAGGGAAVPAHPSVRLLAGHGGDSLPGTYPVMESPGVAG